MTRDIEEMAGKAFAEHQITRRFESELVRHYRCQKPGTWIYGFDVTFTPGWVFIHGDIGHLALSREADMLPWLRRLFECDRIDFRYAAQKAPQCITTREWTEEAAHRAIDNWADGRELSADDRQEMHTLLADGEWDAAVQLMYEHDSGPLEIDPRDWTPGFLWCLYGLRWFVRAHDGRAD